MKQLLCILSCCMSMTSYTAEETPLKRFRSESSKKQAVEQELTTALSQKLIDGTGTDLLDAVKKYSFLRKVRIADKPIILRCIWNVIVYDKDYNRLYPKEQIEALTKLGVPIDQQGSLGETALMEVSQGFLEDVRWGKSHIRFTQGLLDHKADPTLQDDNGYNALGHAFSFAHRQRQIIALLKHEKIPSIINQPTRIHGKQQTYLSALINSPASFDGYRFKIMKALLRAGARITAQDRADALKQPRWQEPKTETIFLQESYEENQQPPSFARAIQQEPRPSSPRLLTKTDHPPSYEEAMSEE